MGKTLDLEVQWDIPENIQSTYHLSWFEMIPDASDTIL